MVAVLRDAAVQAGVPAPRRPWLDELAPVYDLSDLPAAPAGGLSPCVEGCL